MLISNRRKLFSLPISVQKLKRGRSFSNITLGTYLNSHNLVYQTTNPNLLTSDPMVYLKEIHPNISDFSAYCGFDPTASALHLGNFILILTLIRLNLFGFTPIFLIGGATGLIGDPSGKSIERKLLETTEVQTNLDGIEKTLTTVIENIYEYLQNEPNLDLCNAKQIQPKYSLVNNAEFYQNLSLIHFIRDFGKHFKMQVLLNKETVANRLKNEDSISFAEFSYQLLQAYDFYQLFQKKNCVLQIGGSDQWGNITNGCDLVKKILKKEIFGFTTPLLLTSSGKKFGKSEGNAIWLTSDKTKPYDMFQYFFNTSDQDVDKYLKLFTFFSEEKIIDVMKSHNATPEKRIAQNTLAETITKMLYYNENKNKKSGNSQDMSKKLFETDFTTFKSKSNDEIFEFFNEIQSKYVTNLNESNLKNLIDIIVFHNIRKTKSEIRRNIEMGGVYLNGNRVDMQTASSPDAIKQNLLGNKYMVLRIGKKNYYILEII